MRKLQHQTLTPTVVKLDEAVYVTAPCTRLYLGPVELQLCLALGFAPIRLAVLLCWQVWIRRSTGVGISRALSGESGRRTAGTPFSGINHLILQPQQHDPGDAWSARTKGDRSVSLQELTRISETMLCSPTPGTFSRTKYSTKAGNCFLFSPAWPQSIPSTPTVQHIYMVIRCLFSLDVSSLAKYMLAIIFLCMPLSGPVSAMAARYAESNR